MNIKPYYIFIGDFTRAGEKIAEVEKNIKGLTSFDRRVFYGKETSPEEIIKELSYLPVQAEKRLVILRDCHLLPEKSWLDITAYFDQPYAHACLILVGEKTKPILRKYQVIYLKKETPKSVYQIFSETTVQDRQEFLTLLTERLNTREKDFTLILSGAESYLRKCLMEEGFQSIWREKFRQLLGLDFKLKSGQLSPDAGLEIFLYQIIKP